MRTGIGTMLCKIQPEDCQHEAGTPNGYASPDYAAALSEFGIPSQFPHSSAWYLQRQTPAEAYVDGSGPYPFFCCDDYAALAADLKDNQAGLVCLSVVPDPFSVVSRDQLDECFDIVRVFKTHFVTDLRVPFEKYLPRRHRRYRKRGLQELDMELATDPVAHSDEWTALYAHLIERHELQGIQAFTPQSLTRQLEVPGCRYFRASRNGQVQGAFVCYLDRGVAYAHLISTTPAGQSLSAQYALYAFAIEHFRDTARWFALGSVPGLDESHGGGLAFFKSGWATGSLPGYLCGHVLDRERYEELCAHGSAGVFDYFPAYRGAQWQPLGPQPPTLPRSK